VPQGQGAKDLNLQEIRMSTKQIVTALAATLMLGLTALPAMAETQADMSFAGMTAMSRMD